MYVCLSLDDVIQIAASDKRCQQPRSRSVLFTSTIIDFGCWFLPTFSLLPSDFVHLIAAQIYLHPHTNPFALNTSQTRLQQNDTPYSHRFSPL